MNAATPIRNEESLKRFKNYYKLEDPNPRNYLLIKIGLNTALRISDILNLKWNDIYDFRKERMKQYLEIKEKKTGKFTRIYINNNIKEAALEFLKAERENIAEYGDTYIFRGRKDDAPLSRVQAWRIVKKAGDGIGLEGVISPHSLRKTFGYYVYKHGANQTLLVCVFNHSTFNVTKRYLGIDQDEKDSLYKMLEV